MIVLLQKAVQQGYLDGVPLVTSVLFHWGNGTAGMFLASSKQACAWVPWHWALGCLPVHSGYWPAMGALLGYWLE